MLRSLMDKGFYDDHRGSKCPDRLFSKDVRKIKQAIELCAIYWHFLLIVWFILFGLMIAT